MFYLESVFIFAGWLLLRYWVSVDYSEPPPRPGVRFGIRGLLVTITIASALLGAAAA